MKLTANTLTIMLLVCAGMLQAKLTGRARHHSELSRDAHDVYEWRYAGGGAKCRGRLN